MSSDFVEVELEEEEEDILQVTKTYRQSLSDQIKAFRQEQRGRTNKVIQKLTEDQRQIMDKKCEKLAAERADLKAIVARMMRQNLGKEPTVQLHSTNQQQNGKHNGHHMSPSSVPSTNPKPAPVLQNKHQPSPTPSSAAQPVPAPSRTEKSKFKPIFSGEDGGDIDGNRGSGKSSKGKEPMYTSDTEEGEEDLLKPALAPTTPILSRLTSMRMLLPRFLKWEDIRTVLATFDHFPDDHVNHLPMSDYMYHVAGLLVFYAKSLGSLTLTDLASGTLKKPLALGSDAPNCIACVNAQFVKPTVSGLVRKPTVAKSNQKMQIARKSGDIDASFDVCKSHGLGLTFWKTILEIARLNDKSNAKKLLSLCKKMADSLEVTFTAQGLDVIFPKDWSGCTWLPDSVCDHVKIYCSDPSRTSSANEKAVNERPRDDGDEMQPPKKRRKMVEQEEEDDDSNINI